MLRTLTCPQGHSFSVDEDSVDEHRCPECASLLDLADAAAPVTESPKGLWQLMQKADPEETEQDIADPAPKGLWATMKRESPAATEDAEAPANEPAKSKGLWSLMKSDEPTPAVADEPELTEDDVPVEDLPAEASAESEGDSEEAYEVTEPADTEAASEVEDDELEVAPLDELAEDEEREKPDVSVDDVATAEARPRETKPQGTRSRGAVRSLFLGIVAVLISGLALLPEFWLRIPSTLLGFLGLMLGLLSYGEIRRSRGRQSGQGMAICGMALGAAGMLLGPFVFSELGIAWRLKYGRKRTYDNLEVVGNAFNKHYNSHDHYPSGSTYRLGEKGEDIPLHNWQTMLLPYLDEDAAFGRLDLNQPYDSGKNADVMKRRIAAFLASGTDDSPLPNGFAVTHFVALGGQVDVPGVGRVSVGIMDRNSKLRHVDVPDGLGNTLAVGEIAYDFPSWGAPGNYRMIGKGLNKGRAGGFGNSDHTGAMFLMADGSVRFISNKVDPKVLQALSTRNGGEKVDRDLVP